MASREEGKLMPPYNESLQDENDRLRREIERLREALGWVRRQINGCIEYAAYIDNDRSTVGSGALLADLETADDQIEKALGRKTA